MSGLSRVIGVLAERELERRDRIAAAAKCECWRVAGPICATCKAAQAEQAESIMRTRLYWGNW